MEHALLSATVYGKVQGVYFRAFVEGNARELNLTGYTRNLPGGRSVEVVAEGDRLQLEHLVENLKTGPPGARVESVKLKWLQFTGEFKGFQVKY